MEVTADHMVEFFCTSCSAGRRWYYTGAPLPSHLYKSALWRLLTFGASVSRQPIQTSMFLVLGVSETTNPTLQLKFSFTALKPSQFVRWLCVDAWWHHHASLKKKKKLVEEAFRSGKSSLFTCRYGMKLQHRWRESMLNIKSAAYESFHTPCQPGDVGKLWRYPAA